MNILKNIGLIVFLGFSSLTNAAGIYSHYQGNVADIRGAVTVAASYGIGVGYAIDLWVYREEFDWYNDAAIPNGYSTKQNGDKVYYVAEDWWCGNGGCEYNANAFAQLISGNLPVGISSGSSWNSSYKTHNFYQSYNGNPGIYFLDSDLQLGEDGGLIFGLKDTAGEFYISGGLNLIQQSVSPPQLVPVPSAFWLMGSALLGLIGMSRFKK